MHTDIKMTGYATNQGATIYFWNVESLPIDTESAIHTNNTKTQGNQSTNPNIKRINKITSIITKPNL